MPCSDKERLDIVHLCEQRLNTSFGDGCEVFIERLPGGGSRFHATVVFGDEPCEANTCQLLVELDIGCAELLLTQGGQS